jgi:hypothetical protein
MCVDLVVKEDGHHLHFIIGKNMEFPQEGYSEIKIPVNHISYLLKCENKCQEGYPKTPEEDATYGVSAYTVSGTA